MRVFFATIERVAVFSMMMDTFRPKTMRLLALTSLAIGAVFVYLFYDEGFGFNFPMFTALVVLTWLSLSWYNAKTFPGDHIILLATALVFASMVYVRSSELLTFFNVLLSLALLLFSARTYLVGALRNFAFSDYARALLLPPRFAVAFFDTLPMLFTRTGDKSHSSRKKEIVRGVVWSLLLVLLFASLLSSADAVFAKLLSDAFQFEIDEDVVGRVLQWGIVSAFFIGTFGFMLHKVHPKDTPKGPERLRTVGITEVTMVLTSVNLLFGAFIVLQLAHLFGGTAHIVAQGLTYAEYAREGFVQLIWVAVLSFLLISVAEWAVVKNGAEHTRAFTWLSGIMIGGVLIILASAFVRLTLYEEAYGFTTIRLYSYVFMLWLVLTLFLLWVHIVRSGAREILALRMLTLTVFVLFGMNVLNPDRFIALKNLERYEQAGQVDAHYLATLSDDALPHTIHLLEDRSLAVREEYASGLRFRYAQCALGTCTEPRTHSWKAGRLMSDVAFRLLPQALAHVPTVDRTR